MERLPGEIGRSLLVTGDTSLLSRWDWFVACDCFCWLELELQVLSGILHDNLPNSNIYDLAFDKL